MSNGVPGAMLAPLRPLPVHEVQRAMSEYQQGLAAVLDDGDWQVFRERGGDERRFVKRSGWRKIATWFGLDLLVDSSQVIVERDEQGHPLRALVVGRVVAPNGRMAEDVGACSIDERGFSKPEHDIVSTAATRALNRATSNLVGMGDVSAEEILSDVEPLLPEWAQEATFDVRLEVEDRLRELIGDERTDAFMRGVDGRYGYLPVVACGVVRAIHSMLAAPVAEATTVPPQDGEPADPPSS